MGDELERMRMEMDMAELRLLSWNYLGVTEVNYEQPEIG
jgi:hypothetical protein